VLFRLARLESHASCRGPLSRQRRIQVPFPPSSEVILSTRPVDIPAVRRVSSSTVSPFFFSLSPSPLPLFFLNQRFSNSMQGRRFPFVDGRVPPFPLCPFVLSNFPLFSFFTSRVPALPSIQEAGSSAIEKKSFFLFSRNEGSLFFPFFSFSSVAIHSPTSLFGLHPRIHGFLFFLLPSSQSRTRTLAHLPFRIVSLSCEGSNRFFPPQVWTARASPFLP